jgi:hypothetical protein
MRRTARLEVGIAGALMVVRYQLAEIPPERRRIVAVGRRALTDARVRARIQKSRSWRTRLSPADAALLSGAIPSAFVGIEELDQLGEVGKRPRQPVYLVDDEEDRAAARC